MKVVITPVARDNLAEIALAEIWLWNAKERGIRHTDSYIEFLTKSISALSTTYAKGREVSSRPDFRYLLMQRCLGGHAHIAVYEIIGNDITVLHVFHTAQNWQANILEDE